MRRPRRDTPGELGRRGAERVIVRALVLFRLVAVAQLVVAISAGWPRLPNPAASVALTGVVALESLVLVTICLARGRISGASVTVDVTFTAVALVICARLTAQAYYSTWANFIYPFSLVGVLIVGLGVARLTMMMVLSTLLAAAYMLSAVFLHRDPVWNSAPNALSYLANAGVSWLVTNVVRRYGMLLDEQRHVAVEQARELARDAEHARAASLLHNHVLQTLEMLAQQPWVHDEQVRGQIAADASWLRRFVERDQNDDPGGLLDAVHAVCERHARAGMRIEVNDIEARGLPAPERQLDARTLSALAGAVDEALFNVAKHAGVSEATVRIAIACRGVAVTVLDRGCGFVPARYGSGFGQRNAIIARVREAGGTAEIDSDPGEGTQVELWVPWSDEAVTAIADGTGAPQAD
jgi:hypothetical protein